MICTQIRLKNWKNFGEVSVRLSERVFVVGANAAGKSNFLDAFRFLKDVANDGLRRAVAARGGIRKICNLSAPSPGYVELSALLCEQDERKGNGGALWEYTLQFHSTGQFHAVGEPQEKKDIAIRLEKICRDGCVILERNYDSEGEDAHTRQFTLLEQPAANTAFRPVYAYFRNISYVNIIPQLIRESESFLPSSVSEDVYGRSLLETIAATPEKERTERLHTIRQILKMAVPQFSDLAYVADVKGRPHLQVQYHHFWPRGAKQQEDQFSDGTLRFLGIIWAILDEDGLMLLEEPELYLHSEIVKQLPDFIANAQRKSKTGRQIIISSHSYDLLNTDTIAPEEIIILKHGKEDTFIEPASAVKSVTDKIEAGYTPADAVIPQVIPEGIQDGQLSLFAFR